MYKYSQNKTIEDKIEKYVTVNTGNGCWEWTGGIQSQGYGTTRYEGKNWLVHRLVYTYYKGDIAAGLVIDHMCKNKVCCNPDHLQTISPKENVLLGEGPTAKNSKKEECLYGHAYDALDKRGFRYCRTCKAYKMHVRTNGNLTMEDFIKIYKPRK